MDDVFDLKVAAALSRLRLIERALHDRGTWEMEYAGVKAPVTRFVRADRVSMVAHFPALCPLSEPVLAVGVYCDGELIRMLPLEEALDEDGCEVWYDLMLADPVSV